MFFKRKPKNPNEMLSDTKKYLKRIEKYLKRNKVTLKYNEVGALRFVSETKKGEDYIITVNGENEMVWLVTSLTATKGYVEDTAYRFLNNYTSDKNPISIHFEHKYSMIFFTFCFNAELTERNVNAVMKTWWKYFDLALEKLVSETKIEIEWDSKL